VELHIEEDFVHPDGGEERRGEERKASRLSGRVKSNGGSVSTAGMRSKTQPL
jgi:hypothetical protein